jgi:hypothetical protein
MAFRAPMTSTIVETEQYVLRAERAAAEIEVKIEDARKMNIENRASLGQYHEPLTNLETRVDELERRLANVIAAEPAAIVEALTSWLKRDPAAVADALRNLAKGDGA